MNKKRIQLTFDLSDEEEKRAYDEIKSHGRKMSEYVGELVLTKQENDATADRERLKREIISELLGGGNLIKPIAEEQPVEKKQDNKNIRMALKGLDNF